MVYNMAMPPQDQPPLPPNQIPDQSYMPPSQPYPQQPAPHPGAYDFIINPAAPPKKLFLPGTDSTLKRIGIIVAGVFVLLIVLIIFKNLLAGKPKLDSMVTVAQSQQ